MQIIWPAYEGSVRTSWYPVIAVLKTTSPSPMKSAPSGAPTKERPSSSTRAAYDFSAGNDHRLVDAVLFGHQHLDALALGGGHVLAHVVRPDGELAVAAVDQDRKLDGPRAAEVHQGIHGRAGGAAVVDHVVDEHHHLAANLGHVARGTARGRPRVEVVSMHGHVEPAERHGCVLELRERRSQPLRQHVAFADDAHEHDVADTPVALDDLMRDPGQRPADLVRIHDGRLENCAHVSSRSRRAMRMCSPLRAWRK